MTEAALASAELREVLEGRLTDNRRTYPLAPFLEDSALRRYVYYKSRYQQLKELGGDLPSTYEQSAHCSRLVANHGSPVAARAVRNGNLEVLSFLTGLTHRDGDFSSAQLFQKVVRRMRTPGYLGVFLGGTDGGKTNSALLAAGLGLRDDPNLELATNVTTLDWEEDHLNERTHFVQSRSELEDLAEEKELVAVLDEMSTQANAQTKGYEVSADFYPVITFKAKLHLRLFIIGHREDGLDIAPPIRQHADDIIVQHRERNDYEEDIYSTEFYDDIEEGELHDQKFKLSPVPPVAASYDPDETATFDISN